MDFLAEVLKPIPVVVWGGPALEHCGVKAFFYVSATIHAFAVRNSIVGTAT